MQLPAPIQSSTNVAPSTATTAATAPVDKSQAVRLLDVAVFGPMMILAALDKRPPAWMRLALLAIGAGTVLYNGRNYLMNLRRPQG